MDRKKTKKRKVFLLFHKSHFVQIYPLLIYERLTKNNATCLVLDSYSLQKIKSMGCGFAAPDCALKEKTRAAIFSGLAGQINEWGKAEIQNKQYLKEFLVNNDLDLWEIIKNQLAVALFDKLYFIELLRSMLLELSPDILVIPPFPRKITLCYLTEINRKTIISLASNLGIRVSSSQFLASGFFYYPYLLIKIIPEVLLSFLNKIRVSRIIKSPLAKENNWAQKDNNGVKKGKVILFGEFPNFTVKGFIPVLSKLQDRGFDCKILISEDDHLNRSNARRIGTIFAGNYKKGIDKNILSNFYQEAKEKWHILIKEDKHKHCF